MGDDKKAEKDYTAKLMQFGDDVGALPAKNKADLDKGDKLIKTLDKETKGAKKGGTDKKAAAAAAEVKAIWAKMRTHRTEAMKALEKVAGACKATKGGAVYDTIKTCEPGVGAAVKHTWKWASEVDALEKTAKGLDPKSTIAKGVRDSIKIQRGLIDAASKTTSTNFAKLLEYERKLRTKKH